MNAEHVRPWDGIAQWLNKKRKRLELEDTLTSMSDRQLKDIGIKREDIQTILEGGLPERAVDAGTSGCPRGLGDCPHCARKDKAA
ncbi:MAG: DUF1127 domain-containing protein [Thermodesulfobacteriota bacterium]